MKNKSNVLDLTNLVFLILCAAIFTALFSNFNAPPIEDAAMLMRYSKHFAEGHGIVWNIGDAPVDGATDFLFMITIGILVKAGLSLEFATRFLELIAYFLTIGVVFLSLRRTFNAPRLIASGSALFLLAGPGIFYVIGYFGTTFFALFASLSWWIALEIIAHGETSKKSLLFAITSVITGLIRPEGVLLTILMALTILFLKGEKKSRITLITYTIIYIIIGTSYFLWHWQYFGYPLPNPFYKKGGGVMHYDSLYASYVHTFFLNMWLLPSFIVGFLFKETRRQSIGFLIPVLGFASLFILIANNMNVLGRFQYVTLPLTAMVCWPLTLGIRRRLNISCDADSKLSRQHIFYSVLAIIFFISTANLEHMVYNIHYCYDGKYYVARMLHKYKNSGYRLATSEAGLLPLYSEWYSLDTWGLNDQWIAHHHVITREYLQQFNPHIIVFHAFFSPVASSNINDEWNDMTVVLKNYAEEKGYILAAAYGENPYDSEYYYVRADFPESTEIIQQIQTMEYPNGDSCSLQKNYAKPTYP
jgi:arabinofuranosyltransferase